MSAKEQIKQLVDYFKREPYLKDKTNSMGDGLLLGAQLADEANERSIDSKDTVLAIQERYKEQILAQDLNPNKDPELVDLRGGKATAGERITAFELSTTAQFQQTDLQLAQSENQAKYYGNYLNKMHKKESVTIVCEGDSMTHGFDDVSADKRPYTADPTRDLSVEDTRNIASKTYPEALQEFFNLALGNGYAKVVNRGYSGDKVSDALTRWNTNPNADLHILMFGTNDANSTVKEFIEKYVALISKITNWGSAVVILTPPSHGLNVDTSFIDPFRKALQHISNVCNVPVIDSTQFTKGVELDSIHHVADRTHFNGLGYQIFASRLFAAICGTNLTGKVYELNSDTQLVPSNIEYPVLKKGDIALNQRGDVMSNGTGDTKNSGLSFLITGKGEITIPFYSTEENLIVYPIFTSQAGATAKVEIDFDINKTIPTSSFSFGKASKQYLNQTFNTSITFESEGSNYADEILADDGIEGVNTKSLLIPQKGWHTIRIKNISEAGTLYFLGLFTKNFATSYQIKNDGKLLTKNWFIDDVKAGYNLLYTRSNGLTPLQYYSFPKDDMQIKTIFIYFSEGTTVPVSLAFDVAYLDWDASSSSQTNNQVIPFTSFVKLDPVIYRFDVPKKARLTTKNKASGFIFSGVPSEIKTSLMVEAHYEV